LPPEARRGAAELLRPQSAVSGRSHTTLGGGSVTSAQIGWPCQPIASACTPPIFATACARIATVNTN
jgi:hypothetical protein